VWSESNTHPPHPAHKAELEMIPDRTGGRFISSTFMVNRYQECLTCTVLGHNVHE
jgi:hypothetical protein